MSQSVAKPRRENYRLQRHTAAIGEAGAKCGEKGELQKPIHKFSFVPGVQFWVLLGLQFKCVKLAACVWSSSPVSPTSSAARVPAQTFLNPSSGPDEWSDLPVKYPSKQKRDYFTGRSFFRANSAPGHHKQLTSGTKEGGSEGAGRVAVLTEGATLQQFKVFIKAQP